HLQPEINRQVHDEQNAMRESRLRVLHEYMGLIQPLNALVISGSVPAHTLAGSLDRILQNLPELPENVSPIVSTPPVEHQKVILTLSKMLQMGVLSTSVLVDRAGQCSDRSQLEAFYAEVSLVAKLFDTACESVTRRTGQWIQANAIDSASESFANFKNQISAALSEIFEGSEHMLNPGYAHLFTQQLQWLERYATVLPKARQSHAERYENLRNARGRSSAVV